MTMKDTILPLTEQPKAEPVNSVNRELLNSLTELVLNIDAGGATLMAIRDARAAIANADQLKVEPVQEPVACLSKGQARAILDLALNLEKTGRLVSLTEGQERSDFVARNRAIQCALEDALRNLMEPEPHARDAITWTPETGYVFAAPQAATVQEPVAWTWDTKSQHDGFVDAHFQFSKPNDNPAIINLQPLYSAPVQQKTKQAIYGHECSEDILALKEQT